MQVRRRANAHCGQHVKRQAYISTFFIALLSSLFVATRNNVVVVGVRIWFSSFHLLMSITECSNCNVSWSPANATEWNALYASLDGRQYGVVKILDMATETCTSASQQPMLLHIIFLSFRPTIVLWCHFFEWAKEIKSHNNEKRSQIKTTTTKNVPFWKKNVKYGLCFGCFFPLESVFHS